MISGRSKRASGRLSVATASRGWLAALLCVAAMACGSEDDDPSSEQSDSGVEPGAMGGGGTPGGSPGGSPGGTPGGTPGGADAGANPGQDSGLPPDLGMNSEGDTFFRADTLVMKTPGLYAKPFGFESPLNDLPQDEVNKTLIGDGDGNGFVDLSLLIRFLKTNDPKAKNGKTTPGGGLCPFPLDEASACGPEPTFPFQTPPLAYTNGTNCKLEGTDQVAAGSCFVTAKGALTMTLAALGQVPLQDAQVIGTWEGTGISNGRVRGFLPKTVAQTSKIPAPAPAYLTNLGIQAGTPLTDFLSDSQLGKNGTVDGWWFLFDYSAKPATFDPAVVSP